MKQLHIHISVEDLEESIRFYSALFATKPSKHKSDYAKWELEDPKMNIAISARGETSGLNHLGIALTDAHELADMRQRFQTSGIPSEDEDNVLCCYAHSSKSWIKDPSGIRWESYHTTADAASYHEPSEDSCGCGCDC